MRFTRDCQVKGKGEMNNRKALIGALSVALVLVAVAGLVRASISPAELYATLAAGQSITETKTVSIPALPPKGDVVFSFDLTGSIMGSNVDFQLQAFTLFALVLLVWRGSGPLSLDHFLRIDRDEEPDLLSHA